MDASTGVKKVEHLSLAQIAVALLRHYLGGRRGLIVLTVTALGAGLIFNWGWLVAAGIAPLLLALAPCAVMCALGICMNKKGAKSCAPEAKLDASGKTSLSSERANEPPSRSDT